MIITVEERIEHIEKHPEDHQHTFSELSGCCLVDGAVDSRLIDAHGWFDFAGENGGVSCDVTEGPCACGAHHLGDD